MIFELVKDFAAVLEAMPQEHPRRRMLKLLDEAIRRDVHFIDRHPTTLFQCLWNTCWWYDHAPDPEPRVGGSDDGEKPIALCRRDSLSSHLTAWAAQRRKLGTNTPWMRALLPPPEPLGGPQVAVLTRPHQQSVAAVAVSPDENRIASASSDGSVVLWDVGSLRILATTTASQSITSIKYSPDGTNLATGCSDGTIRVFCGATLSLKADDQVSEDKVFCVQWLSQNVLVAGGRDGVARIWSLSARRILDEIDFAQLALDLWKSAGRDPREITEPVPLFEDSDRLRDSCRWTWRSQFSVRDMDAYHKDHAIVAVTADQRIHYCRVASSRIEVVNSFSTPSVSASVCFTVDGNGVITGDADGVVRVWNPNDGNEIRSLHPYPQRYGRSRHNVSSLCTGGNENELFAAHDKEWHIRRLQMDSQDIVDSYAGHAWTINSLAYLRRCRCLVSGSDDATVRIWDCSDLFPKPEASGTERPGALTAGAVSADGGVIATGSRDGRVKLWSGSTGSHLKTWVCDYYPTAIRFSADERRIVVAEWEANVWVYDLGTYEMIEIIDRGDAQEWWDQEYGGLAASAQRPRYSSVYNAAETAFVTSENHAPVAFLPISAPITLISENGSTIVVPFGHQTFFYRLEDA